MPVNPVAQGSNMELRYVKEAVSGTTPSSGTMKVIHHSTESFDAAQAYTPNADITSDGQSEGSVQGLNSLTGGFTSELESGGFDDFFLSLFRRLNYTEDSYDDTVTAADGGDGTTATLTFSGAVSISGIITEAPIKLAGFTDTDMNGIFRVISANATTGVLTVGKLLDAQDFSGVSEVGTAATILQKYAKNGGKNSTTFTVEKVLSEINTDDGFIRLKGTEANSFQYSLTPGNAPSVTFDFMGLSDSVHDDGMLGPNGWVVDGAETAGLVSIIDIQSGTTDPAAGDILYIAGDSTNSEYTVVSYDAGALTLDKVLAGDIGDEDKIYFYRPATNPATETDPPVKMFNNLATVLIDGSELCMTSADVTITPSLSPRNCIGNENAIGMDEGKRAVSGTLVPYFGKAEQALITKARAGTNFSISLFSLDTEGNTFCLQIPRVKASKETVKKPDDKGLKQNIPFAAEKDTDLKTTAIIHVLTA